MVAAILLQCDSDKSEVVSGFCYNGSPLSFGLQRGFQKVLMRFKGGFRGFIANWHDGSGSRRNSAYLLPEMPLRGIWQGFATSHCRREHGDCEARHRSALLDLHIHSSSYFCTELLYIHQAVSSIKRQVLSQGMRPFFCATSIMQPISYATT